jgi:tRNA A37 threonylcarbamoyladenosine modification protein TsaB
MSSSLNIPLVAINSLQVEFEPFKSQNGNCWAIIPAGKLKYYVGIFPKSDYNINETPEMNVMNHQELIDKIPNNTSICGEAAFDIYSDPIATEKQIQLDQPANASLYITWPIKNYATIWLIIH